MRFNSAFKGLNYHYERCPISRVNYRQQ